MQFFLKRLADFLLAALLLALLSPVLLVLAFIVQRKLGSPILFRQSRIGKGAVPFDLVKFRTMRPGTAPDIERRTPFGDWLRATSLDELPELWNILKGEMSFVGPRPLLPAYLPYYTPKEASRHRMRPGITGLAQVNGRNALSWDERLALDAAYVEHFSLALDLKILCQTVAVVWKREGVDPEGKATMERLDDVRRQEAVIPENRAAVSRESL